ITQRGRRVFLDYRRDPEDFDLPIPGEECSQYLRRSGALGATPFQRLEQLNAPAIQLYRQHHIDLETQPLEIAVCAQHNNGGLAGNLWWESENIRGLFPVGEVNGSHGVTRPGGSALNAGQVGAFRAAEYIAAAGQSAPTPEELAAEEKAAELALDALAQRMKRPIDSDWREERKIFQQRMSGKCAFIRREDSIVQALEECRVQLQRLKSGGLQCPERTGLYEALRNQHLLTAQLLYLETTLHQLRSGVGSRGSALVLGDNGVPVHPALSEEWKAVPEDTAFRSRILTARLNEEGAAEMNWEDVRPVPECDGWFENIWRDYRTGAIYGGNYGG
ncbi:MAG: FAD-binding protein, partial [Victivallales bacterium]|nr:FAD-binding protein [Victivallales bacterium]